LAVRGGGKQAYCAVGWDFRGDCAREKDTRKKLAEGEKSYWYAIPSYWCSTASHLLKKKRRRRNNRAPKVSQRGKKEKSPEKGLQARTSKLFH